jgi:UDP-N-acetylglucosamine--N-acetylmuramyl-(pentapeptide) pyrophosphoryl-undecaprenol N-acetylglucosamine transferase
MKRFIAFRPGVVFSTGGYASFPACVAARLLFRPVVVYLPDVSPGWAVRAEARLATRMATTTDAALSFLPRRKTVVTGYPVRAAFFAQTREQARESLGIATSERVLLIAGASQGATAINAAVFAHLRDFLADLTVFHITGQADIDEAGGYESQVGDLAARYHPAAFRDDLPTLMLAADLAVMRAGASTLGELTAATLPAILVPGTFAGGHQRENAAWLANGGAAVVLEERDLRRLADTVSELFDEPGRLDTMRAAAARLARPDAAQAIANLVLEVAKR